MPTLLYAIGEIVEWEKHGIRGAYRCRVVALSTESHRPYVVEILGHSWNQNSPRIGERHRVSGLYLRKAL